jgi:cold-inducible RNA-binding protein
VAKNLYVGNLSYNTADSDLKSMFEPHGLVQSAKVIMDRETGRSKGFGFVEMDSGEQAQAAIVALNGQEIDGRALTVNEARPREERGGSQRGSTGSGSRAGNTQAQAQGDASKAQPMNLVVLADVVTQVPPPAPAEPTAWDNSPEAGEKKLQDVLVEINEVAQKVGGYKKLSEIAGTLDGVGK